jgi:hypothetical protein
MATMASKKLPSLSKPGPSLGAKAGMFTGIILVVAIIVGLVAFSKFTVTIKIDDETGCPLDGPKSKLVMIVDQTDTFSAVQVADIKNQFEAYKEKVPRYGQFTIYAIKSPSSGLPSPVVSACNPGTDKDVNQLIESSVQIARKWRNSFDAPMRQVFSGVLQPTESDSSPIIEIIQAVAVKEFGPSWMDNRSKELVIISDLLQHSPSISHYGSYSAEKFTQSQLFKKLEADLRGVDVDILYLQRTTKKAKQNQKHLDFWRLLIQKQNGSVRKVYRVSG